MTWAPTIPPNLLTQTIPAYGHQCTPYLAKVASEQTATKPVCDSARLTGTEADDQPQRHYNDNVRLSRTCQKSREQKNNILAFVWLTSGDCPCWRLLPGTRACPSVRDTTVRVEYRREDERAAACSGFRCDGGISTMASPLWQLL